MAICIDHDGDATSHGGPADSCHIGSCLIPRLANPNGVRFGRETNTLPFWSKVAV